jgi:hypothetical protein
VNTSNGRRFPGVVAPRPTSNAVRFREARASRAEMHEAPCFASRSQAAGCASPARSPRGGRPAGEGFQGSDSRNRPGIGFMGTVRHVPRAGQLRGMDVAGRAASCGGAAESTGNDQFIHHGRRTLPAGWPRRRRGARAKPLDTFSDTWVATDGLGPHLPTSAEASVRRHEPLSRHLLLPMTAAMARRDVRHRQVPRRRPDGADESEAGMGARWGAEPLGAIRGSATTSLD